MDLNINKMNAIIYVRMINEGTEVFRPVEALFINDNIYQIRDKSSSDEEWEFNFGEKVTCEEQLREGKKILVAIKEENI